MKSNPVLMYKRNFLVKRLKESADAPHGPSTFDEPMLLFMLMVVIAPTFVLLMLFAVFAVLFVSTPDQGDTLLTGLAIPCFIAGFVWWAVFIKRKRASWKQDIKRWNIALDEIESTLAKHNVSSIKTFANVTIVKCGEEENKDYPALCNLNIQLDTGVLLENIIAVESPLFRYLMRYNVTEYSLEEVDISEGCLVDFSENKALRKERMEQEKLLRQ